MTEETTTNGASESSPPGKKQSKGIWKFRRKRKFENNFDENGNYIARDCDWKEMYADYYGPLVTDKHGHKAGKFSCKNTKNWGIRMY